MWSWLLVSLTSPLVARGVMEDWSGNWCVYLNLFPSDTELRGRPAVSTHCFHTACQPNDGENYPRWCWGWITERLQTVPSWHLETRLREHTVLTGRMNRHFHRNIISVFYIWDWTLGKFQWVKKLLVTVRYLNIHTANKFPQDYFLSQTLVPLPGFGPGVARPGLPRESPDPLSDRRASRPQTGAHYT